MNYEEKLQIVIAAARDAIKTSPSNDEVNLYLVGNDLNQLDPSEVWDILHKIELEEHVLEVKTFPSVLNIRLGEFEDVMYNTASYFTIKTNENFEKWCANRVTKHTYPISYNTALSELTIGSNHVAFRKDSFRSNLIELLFKSKTSQLKEWSWDEVIAKVEGIAEDDNKTLASNRKKFYPACDGLAKAIASKTGINDLLIFSKTTVRVNPKYISSKS